MRVTNLPLLDDADVSGRRVLVRADLNVPLSGDPPAVADDFRIQAFLPTLKHLVDSGARTVVCSHLGRPRGAPDDRYKMAPVAARLAELAGLDVPVVGLPAEAPAPGEVVMLENLRFHPGETKNDPDLASALAAAADFYVNDAFGACHRAHASITGVPALLPSAAGFLLADEVENLSSLLTKPRRPFVVVLGGAKVSDKIGVVQNLLGEKAIADLILVGGGMCFTFLQAQGHEVGRSLVDEENLPDVVTLLGEAGDRLMLPTDVVCASGLDATSGETFAVDAMPSGLMGLDIGPSSAADFAKAVGEAASVFWNGPMGVFENPAFADGTRRVAEAVASCSGHTVTGGGDTAAALTAFGLDERVDFLSTGGGASLELLQGRKLPGLEALLAAARR